MIRRASLSLGLLCGLAACGGAGDRVIIRGPTQPVPDVPVTSNDFTTLNEGFEAMLALVPDTGALPSQVRTTGTATFTGFFSGELAPDPGTTDQDVIDGNVDFIAGDARILVDFANDGATIGAAGNFRSDTVDQIDGTVAFYLFETERATTAVLFGGSYSGDLTITDPNYPAGELTVGGRFLGGYYGDNGELISLITFPADGFNDIYFDGDVVAQED